MNTFTIWTKWWKTEEIVYTEGHPFYVNNIGWVKSIDLLENDSILLYNNCIDTLK